jgi:hypothetical protein
VSTDKTVQPAQAGPYIVTTKQEHLDGSKPLSRRAAPTLDEARAAVFEVVHGYRGSVGSDYIGLRIAESGGTIGPLRDGTVIEVERASWQDTALAGGLSFPATVGNRAEAGDGKARREILDAYNAQQAQA